MKSIRKVNNNSLTTDSDHSSISVNQSMTKKADAAAANDVVVDRRRNRVLVEDDGCFALKKQSSESSLSLSDLEVGDDDDDETLYTKTTVSSWTSLSSTYLSKIVPSRSRDSNDSSLTMTTSKSTALSYSSIKELTSSVLDRVHASLEKEELHTSTPPPLQQAKVVSLILDFPSRPRRRIRNQPYDGRYMARRHSARLSRSTPCLFNHLDDDNDDCYDDDDDDSGTIVTMYTRRSRDSGSFGRRSLSPPKRPSLRTIIHDNNDDTATTSCRRRSLSSGPISRRGNRRRSLQSILNSIDAISRGEKRRDDEESTLDKSFERSFDKARKEWESIQAMQFQLMKDQSKLKRQQKQALKKIHRMR